MPLYEYRCEECDHRFEVLQPMGADAVDVLCPGCGDDHLSRLYSTFAGRSDGPRPAAAPMGGCCRGTPT